MATKEQVIEALKTCMDPELGVDVYTLGLIYEMNFTDDMLYMKMTFTTPMCPYGPMLLDDVLTKTEEVVGKDKVKIDIVFDPPWKPSEEVKALLGMG